MRKWWLLSAATVLWMASGYALVRSDAGRASEVPRRQIPARIVSMAPNLTEILFALGLESRVVGVTQDSDYPPAAKDKPRVGTFWQPDIESIIATRPDLVVTQTFEQHRDLVRRLQSMGYESLMVDVDTVAGLFDGIVTIGRATGAAVQARTLCQTMRAEVDRLAAATAGQRRVKVLWVVQREPLRVAGRATFVNEMIELAGGENAIGPTLHVYPAIGAEQVIAAAPEVLIEPAMLPEMIDEQRIQAMSYWSRFANVPAVQAGRIHVIDGDIVSRLGPRLPAAIRTIAQCLRPDLFGG
ncbi:MAG: ABC transporter substrate-binding protein [Planctomycetes bacterium]|nr:ABC transporter substrate-binding protein [Planctomycetota bacterium]